MNKLTATVPTEKLALTVREAAALVGVCEKTMYELTRRADFPAIRLGPNRIIIPYESLCAWLRKQAEGEGAPV